MGFPTPYLLRIQHSEPSEPFTAVFRIGSNTSTEIHIRLPSSVGEDEAIVFSRDCFHRLVADAAAATVHWVQPEDLQIKG